jgi:hypothetical protein
MVLLGCWDLKRVIYHLELSRISSHKRHQGRPYGHQTKCHPGGGDISAHRSPSISIGRGWRTRVHDAVTQQTAGWFCD